MPLSAQRRLVSETLESRLVLDGTGGAGFVVFAPFLDSELGDDPHVEEIGPDATHLELKGGVFASIGSYVDSPDDVDAYQFQATGQRLNVGGVFRGDVSFQLFNAKGTPVTPLAAASVDAAEPINNDSQPGEAGDDAEPVHDVEPAIEDGFVGCDWGPFNFCDIFPTDPGETYFVTVGGGQVTEYYYDLFQDLIPKPTTGPDSELGTDPHADRMGREATELGFSEDLTATIHSHIDEPGDVDVFGFRAQGPWMQSFAWMGEELGLRMQIFDAERNLIAANRETFVDPIGNVIVDPFVDVDLEIGRLYFLRVSATDEAVGEYGIDLFLDDGDQPPDQGNPDSAQGEDPHVDTIGPAATLLESEDRFFADSGSRIQVDSYIDVVGDVDVFQVVAKGDSVGAWSYSLDGSFRPTVSVFDFEGNNIGVSLAVGPDGPAPHGPVGAEITPGETYYIRVSALGDGFGEYILEVRETMVVPPPPTGSPDSSLGDDPHADRIDASPTILAFEGELQANGQGEYYVHVDSYIDEIGDVDVFQFVASGNWLSAFAFSWDGSFEPHVTIYDDEGGVVSGGDVDLNGDGWVAPFGDVPLVPGMAYYISIDAADGGMGEYVLDVYQYAQQTLEPLGPGRPLGIPDSSLGADPHADVIGDEATVLEFAPANGESANVSTINSHIDSVDDVDVFQWVAVASRSTVSAYSGDGRLEQSMDIFDANHNLIARSRAEHDGVLWGLTNLSIATHVGDTYYVAIGGSREGIGQYVLNVRQTQSSSATLDRGPEADSELGDDRHGNTASGDATVLSPDASGQVRIGSFIDAPGDIDAFRFTGTGGVAFAVAMNLDAGAATKIRVLDSAFNVLEPGNATDLDPFGMVGDQSLRRWNTQVGQTYYLEVSAGERFIGKYVLNLFAEPPSDAAQVPVDIHREINELIAGLPDGPHVHDRNGSFGDANFDGHVDGLDYGVWRDNKFTIASGPSKGDFNNDGAVDGSDFNIWSTYRFRSNIAAAAAANDRVPRSASGALAKPPAIVANDAVHSSATVAGPTDVTGATDHSLDRNQRAVGSLETTDIETTPAKTVRRHGELVQRRDRVHTNRPAMENTNTNMHYELVDELFARIGSSS